MTGIGRNIWIMVALLLLSVTGEAQFQGRPVAVVLEEVGQEIPDFTLVDVLNQTLTMDEGLDVIIPEKDSTFPDISEGLFDGVRLFEWGREAGCRYILHLQIKSRDIKVRKRTSIPFVLSRYIVEGRVLGSYRLLDMSRDKVIGSWKLDTRLSGPRQWQLGEEYPGDPDLHLSAMRKLTMFNRLDEMAAEDIMQNIQSKMRRR